MTPFDSIDPDTELEVTDSNIPSQNSPINPANSGIASAVTSQSIPVSDLGSDFEPNPSSNPNYSPFSPVTSPLPGSNLNQVNQNPNQGFVAPIPNYATPTSENFRQALQSIKEDKGISDYDSEMVAKATTTRLAHFHKIPTNVGQQLPKPSTVRHDFSLPPIQPVNTNNQNQSSQNSPSPKSAFTDFTQEVEPDTPGTDVVAEASERYKIALEIPGSKSKSFAEVKIHSIDNEELETRLNNLLQMWDGHSDNRLSQITNPKKTPGVNLLKLSQKITSIWLDTIAKQVDNVHYKKINFFVLIYSLLKKDKTRIVLGPENLLNPLEKKIIEKNYKELVWALDASNEPQKHLQDITQELKNKEELEAKIKHVDEHTIWKYLIYKIFDEGTKYLHSKTEYKLTPFEKLVEHYVEGIFYKETNPLKKIKGLRIWHTIIDRIFRMRGVSRSTFANLKAKSAKNNAVNFQRKPAQDQSIVGAISDFANQAVASVVGSGAAAAVAVATQTAVQAGKQETQPTQAPRQTQTPEPANYPGASAQQPQQSELQAVAKERIKTDSAIPDGDGAIYDSMEKFTKERLPGENQTELVDIKDVKSTSKDNKKDKTDEEEKEKEKNKPTDFSNNTKPEVAPTVQDGVKTTSALNLEIPGTKKNPNQISIDPKTGEIIITPTATTELQPSQVVQQSNVIGLVESTKSEISSIDPKSVTSSTSTTPSVLQQEAKLAQEILASGELAQVDSSQTPLTPNNQTFDNLQRLKQQTTGVAGELHRTSSERKFATAVENSAAETDLGDGRLSPTLSTSTGLTRGNKLAGNPIGTPGLVQTSLGAVSSGGGRIGSANQSGARQGSEFGPGRRRERSSATISQTLGSNPKIVSTIQDLTRQGKTPVEISINLTQQGLVPANVDRQALNKAISQIALHFGLEVTQSGVDYPENNFLSPDTALLKLEKEYREARKALEAEQAQAAEDLTKAQQMAPNVPDFFPNQGFQRTSPRPGKNDISPRSKTPDFGVQASDRINSTDPTLTQNTSTTSSSRGDDNRAGVLAGAGVLGAGALAALAASQSQKPKQGTLYRVDDQGVDNNQTPVELVDNNSGRAANLSDSTEGFNSSDFEENSSESGYAPILDEANSEQNTTDNYQSQESDDFQSDTNYTDSSGGDDGGGGKKPPTRPQVTGPGDDDSQKDDDSGDDSKDSSGDPLVPILDNNSQASGTAVDPVEKDLQELKKDPGNKEEILEKNPKLKDEQEAMENMDPGEQSLYQSHVKQVEEETQKALNKDDDKQIADEAVKEAGLKPQELNRYTQVPGFGKINMSEVSPEEVVSGEREPGFVPLNKIDDKDREQFRERADQKKEDLEELEKQKLEEAREAERDKNYDKARRAIEMANKARGLISKFKLLKSLTWLTNPVVWMIIGALIFGSFILITVVIICQNPKELPLPVRTIIELVRPPICKDMFGSLDGSCPAGYEKWTKNSSGQWTQLASATASGGSGGDGSLGVCLDKQLEGKSDTDTVALWRANGGQVKQDGNIPVKDIKSVMQAGKEAGVSSEVVTFVLSLMATESGGQENIWAADNGLGCYGLSQICSGDFGGNSYETWTAKALGRVPSPVDFKADPVMQMKTIAVGYEDKKGVGAFSDKPPIYGASARWLGTGCEPVLYAGYTPTCDYDYGEAALRNFGIITCSGSGAPDLQNNPVKNVKNYNPSPNLAFNPLDLLGGIKAEAQVINFVEERERLAKLIEDGYIYAQNPDEDINAIRSGAYPDNLIKLMLKLYDSDITYALGIDNLRPSGTLSVSGTVSQHTIGEAMDFFAFYERGGKDVKMTYDTGDSDNVGGLEIAKVWRVEENPKSKALVTKAVNIMKSTGVISGSQIIGPDILQDEGVVFLGNRDVRGHDDHIHIGVDTDKPFDGSGVTPSSGSGSNASGNVVCCPPGVHPSGASLSTTDPDLGDTDQAVAIDAKDGVKPTKYTQITQAHRDFLAKIAQTNQYGSIKPEAKDSELTTIDGQQIATTASESFKQMQAAAAQEGLTLTLASGFRGYDDQVGTFFSQIDDNDIYGKATDTAATAAYNQRSRLSAPPGYSEHHTGLAIDVLTNEVTTLEPNDWIGTKSEKWIADNCARFGFKITYGKDRLNTSVGTTYEPWHLYYTGTSGSFNNSKKVENKNLAFDPIDILTGIKANAQATTPATNSPATINSTTPTTSTTPATSGTDVAATTSTPTTTATALSPADCGCVSPGSSGVGGGSSTNTSNVAGADPTVGADGISCLGIVGGDFSPELRAFMRAISYIEGAEKPEFYKILVGGKVYPSDTKTHPGIENPSLFRETGFNSDAFGRYQMLSTTWNAWAEAAGVPKAKPELSSKDEVFYDISPQYQDLAVGKFLQREGVEAMLKAGNIDGAVNTNAACQWASVPGDKGGCSQPNSRTGSFKSVYQKLLDEEKKPGGCGAGGLGLLKETPTSNSTNKNLASLNIFSPIQAYADVASNSIKNSDIPESMKVIMNNALTDKKLDQNEILIIRDLVNSQLPKATGYDQNRYQNLKAFFDIAVTGKSIQVSSSVGYFELKIDGFKYQDYQEAVDSGVVTPPTLKKPCPGGTGGGGAPVAGIINAKGDQKLLEVAREGSLGRNPDGLCYFWVAQFIDRAGGFGKVPVGFSSPQVNPNISILCAAQFAHWMNTPGVAQQYGVKNLLDDNPNASPFNAPPGSIVIVSAGYKPGTHPTCGDITVAEGDGKMFYNGGEMDYGSPEDWNGRQSKFGDPNKADTEPGSGRLLGIYVPVS